MSVTNYSGISKIYFDSLLKKIIRLGNLSKDSISILDFGCGQGRLKKMLGDSVINYDKRNELSEVNNWKDCKFSCFVANHVLYEFSEDALHELCQELNEIMTNQDLKLIIGIGTQGVVSKIGKIILNRKDAHKDTKISPSTQIKILSQYFEIKKIINFWFLSKIIIIENK